MAGNGLRPDRHAERRRAALDRLQVRQRHPTATRHLRPEHIRALAERGWEVGSHSHTHPLLSRLSAQNSAKSSRSPATSSARSWARATRSRTRGARWTPAWSRRSRRAGYAAGSGLSGRFTWGDPMRVPRVAVSGVDDSVRFAIKVAGAHWHLRATGVWPAVEALRGMSGKRDEGPRRGVGGPSSLLNLFNLHEDRPGSTLGRTGLGPSRRG